MFFAKSGWISTLPLTACLFEYFMIVCRLLVTRFVGHLIPLEIG